MWISTRGRYALRVMVDLAENNNGEYIPLKDIAKRQEISEKYLESIMVTMSKAGIIKGLPVSYTHLDVYKRKTILEGYHEILCHQWA